MDPGMYSATLGVATSVTENIDITIDYVVAEGRYDYERIDLPPGRTSLLDPALSQQEREKIAQLREVRTAEKYFSLPFSFPLPGSVTSYYGSRRSYGYGFTSFHAGTDFRAEVGVPVHAPASGIVVLAETLVVRGNAVIIDHGWGVMSGYWHLSRYDVGVGQVIERGEVLGAVGNTGLSTGPHLHWELWVNGVSVSPLAWANETWLE
jgi:murein DD-endopeptidase MepM/ murein hydrolase activator NlpD